MQLRGNAGKYGERVARMFDSMGNVSARVETEKFVKFESEPAASRLLLDANGTVGPDHLEHSKQVLARATLLLRLATGTVSDLLRTSGLDFEEELEFWWNGDSVRRRLWSEGVAPESFADLWIDVETALEDAGEWLKSGKEISHWGFWNDSGRAGWTLSTVERAFLWGLP